MNTPAKLFSPGPTPLSESVSEALSAAPLHHRSAEFKVVVKETLSDLEMLFDGEKISVFTSTGTGALEASVVNFISSKDTVVTIDGGKFGERWSEILSAYKIDHHNFKTPWGSAPDLEELKTVLADKKPSVLCFQACETSTGTAFPVADISKILAEVSPTTLVIVDGVTAVGAYPLSMKDNAVDVLITGSQKALGLPVGLSFMGISKRALEKAKTSDLPKYYFNILKELQSLEKNTTWFSSPTQLWQSLNLELKKLRGSGLQQKYKNCRNLQKQVHHWADENRLKLFSKNPSPSLTALSLPKNIKASDVQKAMLKKGYYLATGQAEFKERLLRIGHMANIEQSEMSKFLELLKVCLKELGH